MIISVNWLKKFVDIDLSIDKLAELIGARLVEIEKVIDLGAKYKDVYIAKVVEAVKLEGSDHLNVTKIDDSGRLKDATRDENGYIQVVCGADNVTAGINIAWLPPNSIVPNTFNTDSPFKLGVRELRGVTSNGMIASARELDLFDEHDGILILDDNLSPGDSFAAVYELDDYLLDIENKSLTHRPDTFGVIGFAREVAAVLGQEFKTDAWLKDTNPEFDSIEAAVRMPKIVIDDSSLSSRFQMVALSGAAGDKTSPMIFQTYLARVGMRPVSAVVDATNYMMLLTGQPLGIYDYDKVMALCDDDKIHVRGGRTDEELELLDGRKIKLVGDDIVISAGGTAIGLAGAMGGANTVVDESTKNIMIESASFNLYNLRSTQMRHGIFSEAITRFTKGQPPELTAPVLAKTIKLINEWTGAKLASEMVEDYPVKTEPVRVDITVDKINDALGSRLSSDEIKKTLGNAEFEVGGGDDDLDVLAPYWRADIHIPEDIVEEVGRLNGYDSIELDLPTRDFTAVSPDSIDKLREVIRTSLMQAGASEVLTYSFVHGDILEAVGQSANNSYRITNSISPDLQYYRQSLSPSLLQLVHPNLRAGFDSFALFEINKVHPKHQGVNDENVPSELNVLGLTFASGEKLSGAVYYKVKKLVEFLGKKLGVKFIYKPIDDSANQPYALPFEHRRSALIIDAKSGVQIGLVGEYRSSVRRAFKLPEYSAGFEIDVDLLLAAYSVRSNNYKPSSRYPSTDRDICFRVKDDISYQNVIDAAEQTITGESDLEIAISPVDIYQADGDDTKNITIRINVASHVKTLTGQDAADIVSRIIAGVATATDATVV